MVNIPKLWILIYHTSLPTVFHFLHLFLKLLGRKAKSVDHDHIAQEQSDLGLHCQIYHFVRKVMDKILEQLSQFYYIDNHYIDNHKKQSFK